MLQDANHQEIQALSIGTQLAPLASGAAPVSTGVIDADNKSLVRIIATEDIYLDIGLGATASALHTILPAGVIEYFVVPAGGNVSVLQLTSAGSVRVTVME
jgi:hypothetical protein